MNFLRKIKDKIKKKHKKSDTIVIKYINNEKEQNHWKNTNCYGNSHKEKDEIQYEIVEKEILPEKIICPDCGGITLEGLEFCDKCGGELMIN